MLVCEVMGRHAGWIAAYAGIAGGAAAVLVPERPFDLDALCASLIARHDLGNYASVVVVAEGAAPMAGTFALADGELDAFGHVRLGGIGDVLAKEIEKRTGFETRATVLGHIQRGGTPTAFDRVLATRFGVAAVEAVHDGAYGTMVALQNGNIVRVPLLDAVGELKTRRRIPAGDRRPLLGLTATTTRCGLQRTMARSCLAIDGWATQTRGRRSPRVGRPRGR